MIRELLRGVLLSYFLLLSGCTALNSFEDALEEAGWAQVDRSDRLGTSGDRVSLIVRRADGTWVRGAGAAVRGGHVLTVAHVLDGASGIEAEFRGRLMGIDARIKRRIPAVPEDLVELDLQRSSGIFGFSGLDSDEVFETASGAPTQLWSSEGLFRLPCLTRPGDSGSPLLDDQGRLVGLLVGRAGGNPVWVSVPHATQPAQPNPHLIPISPHDALALGGKAVWELPAKQAVRDSQALRLRRT